MFFIAWGNKWQYKVKQNGLSVNKMCPACDKSGEFFEVIPTKYFALFWIPLAPTETKKSLLECPHCHARLYIQQHDYNNAIKGFSGQKRSNNIDRSNCIIFQCENCTQKLRIPIKNKLLKITCPVCKKIFYFHDGKQTYNSEETASEKPKTKGWNLQQKIINFISGHKKAIAYGSVVIGIFLLCFLPDWHSTLTQLEPSTSPPSVKPEVPVDLEPIKPIDFKPIKPTLTQQEPSVTPSPKPEVMIDSEPMNPNRLRTGAVPSKNEIRSGHSEITVDNGNDTDSLVRVLRFMDGKQQNIRIFYVRSNDKFIAKQIPQGEYVLKVAFGTDWNADTRKFNYRRSFGKTQKFTIDETTSEEQTDAGEVKHTKYSKLSITLHKVPHGNFKSYPINEDEFWQ
jgi:uncharacterized protein YbaR (Trm112 family)